MPLMETRGHQRKRLDDKSPRHQVTSYWERTLWPLQSLYFLLPLLLGYELGAVMFAPEGDERLPQIYAERMLGRFFEWTGVTGYYLPGIATAVILLCWHFARRDPWKPEPRLYLVMLIESAILAAPLFIFSIMMTRPPTEATAMVGAAGWLPMLASGLDGVESWRQGVIFSIGAGIYEELVFRLIVIALVHMLLSDVLALPKSWSAGGAIAISAILFALYHPFDSHYPWQWDSLEWGRFAFYTLAGLYFAAIYVYRGFGIVAATHALYDVMVIATHFRNT
ncbi:CPBP family intramembrane glutamic endopeptidase [Algisphaera agarilytica]|uniref:Membrane protease YdiL (CAAX protease family) n=1 Tax=Algisphaera agarilytica TaxID=1385975 RepID=A0A7X0LKT7_9BACT|nr:CPBP family intramembrane glutamic endopeptidase [Algisphaera agarilytica]MBB6429961.1 membrane protease YdiL (CAAX protease family) [Algisphaera agarilytica]